MASRPRASTTASAPSAQKYRPGSFSYNFNLCRSHHCKISVGPTRLSAPRTKFGFFPKYRVAPAAIFVMLHLPPPDAATLRAGDAPISRTRTRRPRVTNSPAAAKPAAPAPIIITSYCFICYLFRTTLSCICVINFSIFLSG